MFRKKTTKLICAPNKIQFIFLLELAYTFLLLLVLRQHIQGISADWGMGLLRRIQSDFRRGLVGRLRASKMRSGCGEKPKEDILVLRGGVQHCGYSWHIYNDESWLRR